MLTFLIACRLEPEPASGPTGTAAVVEACADGVDNDANGAVDCADPACDGGCPESCADVRDNDGDGLVDCDDLDCVGSCAEVCDNDRDDDGDGRVDCSDTECNVATCAEVCADARDNDADGLVDCMDVDCDGSCPEACWDGRDNDGDGGIDCADVACEAECPESCAGGVDDDADGLVDCADPECGDACDVDGDGHFTVALGGDDCDDLNVNVYPGAPERCNGSDDDCDTLVDEADPDLDPAELVSWYADNDADTFGNYDTRLLLCLPPVGWVVNGSDCDDTRADVHPLASEVCNGVDDECDGLIDSLDPTVDLGSALVWYGDADADGYGDPASTLTTCEQPDGYVDNSFDCDDTDPEVFPSDWLFDLDADGFGAGAVVSSGPCEPPADTLARSHLGLDCNDNDSAIAPDQTEVCEDLIDQDCDTLDAPCTRELLAVKNGSYELVAIDVTKFTVRSIGSFGAGVYFWYGGITWDPVAEIVYMVDGDATSNLWSVDPRTGAATLVGNMGSTRNFSIVWDPERETLFVASVFPGVLHEVDPATAASVVVGALPDSMDGLTWDTDLHELVGLGGGSGDVWKIDRDTAAATLLFDGPWVNNAGFAFDPVTHGYWAVDLTGSLYQYDLDPWNQSVAWYFPQSYDGLVYVGDALVE